MRLYRDSAAARAATHATTSQFINKQFTIGPAVFSTQPQEFLNPYPYPEAVFAGGITSRTDFRI